MKFTHFLPAALIAGVAASPVQPKDGSSVVLENRATTASAEDLANIQYYVQYAAAAYCNSDPSLVGKQVSCSSSACPSLTSSSITNYAFVGFDQSMAEGFVSVDTSRQTIVLAVMGSNTIAGFIADILFPFETTSLCSGCKAHQGWYDGWGDIKSNTLTAVRSAKAAYPSYKVVVAGHSLGAAVGTLAAAYLRAEGIATDLYTYGAPMVGNEALVKFINGQTNGRSFRVTHVNDPIPRYPPTLFGYRQTDTEYWLKTGSSSTTSYTAADVQVCTGLKSSCNGDQSGLDLTAHSYYFQKVSACKGSLTY